MSSIQTLLLSAVVGLTGCTVDPTGQTMTIGLGQFMSSPTYPVAEPTGTPSQVLPVSQISSGNQCTWSQAAGKETDLSKKLMVMAMRGQISELDRITALKAKASLKDANNLQAYCNFYDALLQGRTPTSIYSGPPGGNLPKPGTWHVFGRE